MSGVGSAEEVQAHDAGDDEQQTCCLHPVQALAEEQCRDDGGRGSADTGPDGVRDGDGISLTTRVSSQIESP